MRKWRQGIFTPINQNKFIGSKAVYRSGLELKFFRFCDSNQNVKKWGSENVVVPYISPLDKRAHRYYVDNYIEILEGKYLKKYLVEIKPSKQTKPPTTKYRKRRHLLYEQRAYVINQAKWAAARNYSKKNGCEFIILTEKELILNK
tara:strand:+ start:130 stop:567 length:438 start_codon:yes stop_codon:yes gene_type:complete